MNLQPAHPTGDGPEGSARQGTQCSACLVPWNAACHGWHTCEHGKQTGSNINYMKAGEPGDKAHWSYFLCILPNFETCPAKMRKGNVVGRGCGLLEAEPGICIPVPGACVGCDYSFVTAKSPQCIMIGGWALCSDLFPVSQF